MSQPSAIENHEGALILVDGLWKRGNQLDRLEDWAQADDSLHGAYMLTNDWAIGSELSFLEKIARQRKQMAREALQ